MKNCNCNSCSNSSCRSQGSCKSQECQNKTKNHDSHERFFLELADRAWTEALKEKIKEHIIQQDNECLTELARIIAGGNKKRWEGKMCREHSCHDFEEQLCSFFSRKNTDK